ncbi:hypothetical protein [Pleurocapsa sp. PCC 7319]|uniref:hypothetical protein n=1 Tax=Pleurocapsa sp. PCC 7319 TaxID=118161 RepID=UPI00037820F6|nr:hypothetical protein [Pleurocapsa sp. PCC 7319]
MKIKLMPILAGFITLSLVAVPLTAQACSGGDKDKSTSESNLPEQTESSFTVEESSSVPQA